jgi:cell division septum initiation protein DivIVA
MPLPIPSPGAVFDLTRSAVALPARAFRVLDDIEALVRRVDGIADRAEEMLDRFGRAAVSAEDTIERARTVSAAAAAQIEEAAKVAAAAGVVVSESQQIAEGAGNLVAEARRVAGGADEAVTSAAATAARAEGLLVAYEPALRHGAPMANRFVEQVSPEEIEAAIKLVDELPKLTRHLHADILPILATLDRVGPDIHDLLEVTRDLKLAVAGIPGLKMLMRRGEDRLTDE